MTLWQGRVFLGVGLLGQRLVCLFGLPGSCLPGPHRQFILPSGWTGRLSSRWCFVTAPSTSYQLSSHSSSPHPHPHPASQYTPRVVQQQPICPLESSVAYSAGWGTTFSLFFQSWGKGVFRGLWEGETGSQGLMQARSYWLSESCYFVLRTGMSLLLLGTPEANHSEGVWSCPVWERALRSLCLPAACLPTQPCTPIPPPLGLPSIPWLTLPGVEQKPHTGSSQRWKGEGTCNFKVNVAGGLKVQ